MTADPNTTPLSDAIRVADNPEASRFEAYLDGQVAGFSEYLTKPGRLIFTHTVVEPEYEGKGVGSKLVREELDDAMLALQMIVLRPSQQRRSTHGSPVCWRPFIVR